MCASDFRVLRKMDVRCSVFKLLLFQMLVVWCAAKHVTLDELPRVEVFAEDLQDVQDSLRNLEHTGIYSHRHLDRAAVQVVTPVKVTADGALVSRAVDHAHAHGHARARRDLHDTEHTMPHELHYNLTVDGRELRLDLRPSVTFITPALVIERHRASTRTRERPREEATSCHYTGVVRGQPNSAVALSACDGLAGLLRTNHGEYWIEPSTQKPTDNSEGRPHVIFKRSAVDKVDAYHRARGEINKNQPDPRQRYRGVQTNQQILRNNNAMRWNRQSKEAIDRKRRLELEERHRRMEALRRNPIEYRKHQARLRLEQRRKNLARSNSVEASKSFEASSNRNSDSRQTNVQSNPLKPKRIKNKNKNKRRRRRARKNCATKQPPYQWKNNTHIFNDKTQQLGYQRKNLRNMHHNNWRQSNIRSTRSVSKPRHVEVLLVADRSMTDFHNTGKHDGKLETYLLTIMNMVSSLYMDPSIGNYIKIVIVKIILVEEVHSNYELNVSTNADTTLESFCRWQQHLNPEDDANPHHHDVAILVTRQDICSQHDTPCSTLGVAHVAGMCKPDRSCSVNEDNGIMLAHTITHELGHNFGLYHDTEKIGCHRREGSTLHIMTPIFEPDTKQVAWSRCSKRDVTNFLDAGLGECLSDRPSQEEYVYPEVPAGVTFDAATQCHLIFGAEAEVCSKPTEVCTVLWCLVNNTCISMLRAAAPGTTCGHNMWCQNLTCVPRTPSPLPRDGGWGPWSEWSECSRTCGAGVSTQSRECNNPEPLNNGNYCIGARSQYKVCNIDPCPVSEPSFREVQCSKYNNESIKDWVPYFDQDKPCDLTCVPRNGNNDFELVGGFVADGTPCRQSPGSKDMCIVGVCYKVGCDWVVDSDLEEDACGVCGGNGSACKTVQGIYNKESGSGFSEVAVIPAGSRNVKIEEKVSPGNYISIGSARSKKIYLSGARNGTVTEYFVAGTQAIYERGRDWEKVQIPGPLAEDIKVYQRIFRGKHRNPGVTYQYTVDRQRPRRRYSYRVTEWSACSASCGLGYMRRRYDCVDERGRVVAQSQCYHIEAPRSLPLMQRCRGACQPALAAARSSATAHAPAPYRAPAPARAPATARASAPASAARTYWWVGSWSGCGKHCRIKNEQVIKRRKVYCVKNNKVVADAECNISSKPIGIMQCSDLPAC